VAVSIHSWVVSSRKNLRTRPGRMRSSKVERMEKLEGKRNEGNSRPFQKPKRIGHPRDCAFGSGFNFLLVPGAWEH